jgi:C_GCAxxG_C_C family probable redox protein
VYLKQKTRKLWSQKLNCAECALKLLSEEKNTELNEQIFKAVEIYGGGLKSGCVCGALLGAVTFMAIALPEPSIPLTQKFYAIFREKYGSSCCRVLRAKDKAKGIPKNTACPERVAFACETALKELKKLD